VAIAGSLALAVPQVAGAASGHGGARHRQKHHKPNVTVECVQQRPVVALTPVSNAGGVVEYGVQVTNMDSEGCAPTTFIVQDWMNGGSAAEFYTATANGDFMNNAWVDVSPGRSASLRMRAFGAQSGGSYSGGIGAVDLHNHQHAGYAIYSGVVS
jgi:hypothetical protein